MRWIKAALAAVLGTGILAPVAHATLAFSLVKAPISPAAKAAEASGSLNTARSFDLMVTQTGEKWQGSALQLNLGATGNLNGSLYTPTGHSNILSNTPATANLGFDTAITTPRFQQAGSNAGDVDVLGNSDYKNPLPSNNAAVVSGATMSISWGDKQGDNNNTVDGTFRIARITVTGNTGGFLNGYGVGTAGQTATFFNNLYLPILGDSNGDFVVNQLDLNAVNQNFLSTTNSAPDFNADGVVNQLDLNSVNQNFLNTITPPPGPALGSIVPEPASLGIVGLMAIGGLCRRSRRA